jgi:four helix bundle protein
MADAILYNEAYTRAVSIVKGCQQLADTKREFVLSKQLLRAGTSIAANKSEANGAISKAEFTAKISIAYKECRETTSWSSLLKDTEKHAEGNRRTATTVHWQLIIVH